MIVGFDTRFLSDRYAKEAARVLAANGFNVFLCQADAPTPVISYAVKNMNAIGGIMITASHNAPRYNGVKLKAAYGGSALPELCRKVEVYLNDNESQGRGPNLIDYDVARDKGLITRFNPLPAYQEHVRKLINFDVIAENPQYVVVDSMYGSARGVIKGLLEGTGCEVHEIRNDMNPGFGGVHPEPIAHYLNALSGAICMGRGSIGLATDGDGDRLGAMDERGVFVDPHKIMALSLRYLAEKRKLKGTIVRTVSTTRMIDLLAERYGLTVQETPVGFNHIVNFSEGVWYASQSHNAKSIIYKKRVLNRIDRSIYSNDTFVENNAYGWNLKTGTYIPNIKGRLRCNALHTYSIRSETLFVKIKIEKLASYSNIRSIGSEEASRFGVARFGVNIFTPEGASYDKQKLPATLKGKAVSVEYYQTNADDVFELLDSVLNMSIVEGRYT